MDFLKMIEFLRLPAFEWIQVEVSSKCNADCMYCPHGIYKERWIERNMSFELYGKLFPAFKKSELVYLQGWGEPLLNPDFFKMVEATRQYGCLVGTSTNGTLINSEVIEKVFDSGLDIIAFSLAAATDLNDTIRKGTKFEKIMESIARLDEEKRKRKLSKPEIHIAYLLLRSYLSEAERLPEIFKNTGVSQVVISTLDFVPSFGLDKETIKPLTLEEYNLFASQLDDIVENGRRSGINIYYRLFKPGRPASNCTENIQHSLFVSSDGSVSPYVFTNLPVDNISDINMSYEQLIFGNVDSENLSDIWTKDEYKSFRASFYSGDINKICQNCPKMYMD